MTNDNYKAFYWRVPAMLHLLLLYNEMQDFLQSTCSKNTKHLVFGDNITKNGMTKYEAIWKSKVEMPKYTQHMILNCTDATFRHPTPLKLPGNCYLHF